MREMMPRRGKLLLASAGPDRESLGLGATHELGEADADPHCGARAPSRLLAAVATPPSAVTTAFTVLVLGWAVRLETAVLSVSSADFTAPVWALNLPCSAVVRVVNAVSTLARSDLISSAVPFPILTWVRVSTDARSPAAAWHTADVGLGAGAAAAAVAAGVALGDGLLLGDEVLEVQAARSSPAARAAAAMRHRPGPVTVAQIVFASSPPQALTTPAVGCTGPMAIVLPPLTQSTGLPPLPPTVLPRRRRHITPRD